ncbi:MAG TPA: bifunctional 5,10-methylenetetrahydrofolate dehydrogenase/5,10-methenyltetrahydrofolate cyclohydrolase [Bacteroidales bacterium]|nr:bifunctional 5,10-methylenetetrahydrofolate dehydrogenase/5,10-methenyltetrahydrofolate cyclohydrolase [Bacteroidales bacterium]
METSKKTPIILDGRQIAADIKKEIAIQVEKILDSGIEAPHIAAIIVGEDGASKTYVESIQRNAKEVGFISSIYQFPSKFTENELIEVIEFINRDEEIDGYIIQLPLPDHISVDHIINHVNPMKDVDCFHPANMGNLVLGKETFLPATPHACMEILKRYHIEVAGKNCVVVGRSNIVGKPLALLLSQNSADANGTVTITHSKTQNLKEVCKQADILLVAIGKPEMITKEYVKEGATVIDVGIHRIEDKKSEKGYKIVGDVKHDEVDPICSAVTPVPGGVGAVTMSCLLLNTLKAYTLTRGSIENLIADHPIDDEIIEEDHDHHHHDHDHDHDHCGCGSDH